MPDPSSTHLPDGGDSSFLRQLGRSQEVTEFHSPAPEGYEPGRHRYVAVLGTVMSGLGKGIFSSSVAKLLKDKGLVVAPIKMEGYLNIDSGTLNPFRHGEVFVLDDGTECDMDLGTYERVLDQNLTRANFITSGQIYAEILERERKGGFLGRDVQMIPHVTGEVKLHVRRLAMTGGPGGGPADAIGVAHEASFVRQQLDLDHDAALHQGHAVRRTVLNPPAGGRGNVNVGHRAVGPDHQVAVRRHRATGNVAEIDGEIRTALAGLAVVKNKLPPCQAHAGLSGFVELDEVPRVGGPGLIVVHLVDVVLFLPLGLRA